MKHFVKDEDLVGATFEKEVVGTVIGNEFEFCDFLDQVERQVSSAGNNRL